MTPPPDRLNKLYIEATTGCNLDCQMCVRHAWEEPIGAMSYATFTSLMEQVKELPAPPTIHFGGFGEPMSHPRFLDMAQMAKDLGARVEMTTNGMLLTEDKAMALFEMGFDQLFVSIDSVDPQKYADIRVGADFNQVFENLKTLRRLKLYHGTKYANPQVGIAFVVMKSNIHELPLLPHLAIQLNAKEIKVSNLVPHLPEMENEIVYDLAMRSLTYRRGGDTANTSLPKINFDEVTGKPLRDLLNAPTSVGFMHLNLNERENYCQFVQDGYAMVCRDGRVAPCMSYMHAHTEYLKGYKREIKAVSFGNIREQSLKSIWESEEYTDFRRRLKEFKFSPCTFCSGCDLLESNETDCAMSPSPACGGCVWTQGFVQCP